jgi:hypothetical protein
MSQYIYVTRGTPTWTHNRAECWNDTWRQRRRIWEGQFECTTETGTRCTPLPANLQNINPRDHRCDTRHPGVWESPTSLLWLPAWGSDGKEQPMMSYVNELVERAYIIMPTISESGQTQSEVPLRPHSQLSGNRGSRRCPSVVLYDPDNRKVA